MDAAAGLAQPISALSIYAAGNAAFNSSTFTMQEEPALAGTIAPAWHP